MEDLGYSATFPMHNLQSESNDGGRQQRVGRQHDIVVTINYEVNIFLFPNVPGLETQNVGIPDQNSP
ncbi:hypothetical protein F4824DRAFT_504481 [Ustulina deusta]|nr:hypothetical protein F4824DRAFT_504481 [Ustulina deusta]